MKNDIPPLRMTVEAGKLAPADAFSAERLESYRYGTTMFVQPITDPQSKKRRKFWAILGLVIKNCNTPWRTVKDAANAIKRTFGLMDDGGTAGTVRIMYPRSLNDLTEPEFEEFYEDAMLYLERVTGIDPETLSKESPDPGDDEPPASSSSEADAGSGGGESPNPEDNPAAAATPHRDECIAKFLRFATDEETSAQWKLENLAPTVKAAWVQQLPDDIPFVEACCRTAEQLIRGESKSPEATCYLHALAAKPKENGNGRHEGRNQENLRSGQSGR
ncbi:hypothetical protein GOL30_11085 [Sinorhizobium medicae]|uniref:hypothetical protein n=1 Tax=Sinorhizobium medicae TaxID=110321 RepID=UPI0004228FB4|nr:hypothetical protein [Sinorhizobium medicae]MDX0428026.1 hypothetical protein [Sinorhizobium medicae]MDX0987696.1 hypothetical protein [Sinorhizobium medicae]MDX1075287.1 hypothetical protein [Sinorhizobium medicae]